MPIERYYGGGRRSCQTSLLWLDQVFLFETQIRYTLVPFGTRGAMADGGNEGDWWR